jgi:hypothetical protein
VCRAPFPALALARSRGVIVGEPAALVVDAAATEQTLQKKQRLVASAANERVNFVEFELSSFGTRIAKESSQNWREQTSRGSGHLLEQTGLRRDADVVKIYSINTFKHFMAYKGAPEGNRLRDIVNDCRRRR